MRFARGGRKLRSRASTWLFDLKTRPRLTLTDNNVIQEKRGEFNVRVNRIGLLPIPTKPHHAELRLDLARINLHYADPARDQLLPQGLRESADRRLGGAVDAAPGVALAAGDRAHVDDVAGAVFDGLRFRVRVLLGV